MGSLASYLGQQRDNERAENERLNRENASLREQLRLANDKMAEQVRQARWDVAHTALNEYGRENMRLSYLQRVLDANAPKD